MTIAFAVLLLTAGTLLSTSPATASPIDPAVGCYQDTCTAKDPGHTYNSHTGAPCSSGAYNVLSAPALGGTLQLRWGPNCGTNWTRFTPGNNHTYQIWVTRATDGLSVGDGYHTYQFSNGSGVLFWTDQIYSPGPAHACVHDNDAFTEACISQ